MREILEYLEDEVADGEPRTVDDLTFIRTAKIYNCSYWIWGFHCFEGSEAFVIVSFNEKSRIISFDTNDFGLSPEQFVVGTHYRVF